MNELQKRELDILKEIIQICDRNDLTYYAYGGTLIGAVRHKGFIPWDDDIDILMPRDDYDKFTQISSQLLPDYLELRNSNSFPDHAFLFSKVHDIRTTVIGDYEKNFPNRFGGVFVDIFPLDGLPNSEGEKIKTMRKYIHLLDMNNYVRPHLPRNNSLNQKVKSIVRNLFSTLFSFNHFSKKLEAEARKYKFDESSVVLDISSLSSGCDKYIFLKEWFESTIDLPFEDISIKAPIGYDAFLRKMYGDYMILPPEENRDVHGTFLVDFDHSYKCYQEKALNGETLQNIK